MTYRILARKTRPQDFSAVVGQEATVQALRNALGAEKIASAYLFSGIRGVGKTSVARIFAKALNCDKGPASDPCNDCVICKEITGGSDLDVLEIDAATYSKVEQVRELTESLKYGPARDRYKVVILDEIHRLSKQAFDALLKIVEEPPKHLVFIFATTESHAIPATILSRCQEFNFRRVPFQALTEHLRALSAAEGFEASETALRMIARAGDGSVRDAVALLDQLSIYGSNKIQDQDASRLLGGLDAALYLKLLEAILTGESGVVVRVVADIEAAGWDPRLAYADFLAYCRDALHLSLGGSQDQVDLPQAEASALAGLCKKPEAGRKKLLRLLHYLLQSENTVRRTEAGALALEIVWLRMAELPLLSRIEDVLEDGPQQPSEPAKKISIAGPIDDSAAKPRADRHGESPSGSFATSLAESGEAVETDLAAGSIAGPALEPVADAASPSARPEEVPTAPASLPDEPAELSASDESPAPDQPSRTAGGASDKNIQELLHQISRRKQPLAAHLAGASKLWFAGNLLSIHLLPSDAPLRNALSRTSNRQLLDECVKQVWSPAAHWLAVENTNPQADVERTEKPEAPDPALQHPTVQAALDIFGGTARALGPDDR